jgi:hypothetical protein
LALVTAPARSTATATAATLTSFAPLACVTVFAAGILRARCIAAVLGRVHTHFVPGGRVAFVAPFRSVIASLCRAVATVLTWSTLLARLSLLAWLTGWGFLRGLRCGAGLALGTSATTSVAAAHIVVAALTASAAA